MIPTPLNPLGLNHQNYFVLTVQPDAAHLTYSFTPNWDSGGFCRVDWGDGISENAVLYVRLTHTYSAPGCYRIRIQGELSQINFAQSADSGDILSDCNWNWRALGSIKRVSGAENVKHQLNTTLTKLPESLNSLSSFAMESHIRVELNGIPDGVVDLSYAFKNCPNFIVSVSKIPHGVAGILDAFDRINTGSFFDLDSISENAPLNGWTLVDALRSTFRCDTPPGYSTSRGSIAGFMRKFPNVVNVAKAFTGFTNASGVTCFGEDDYCSFTITTTDANQVWGFTPVSSAGRWYVFDWGDGTAETTNKNVDRFTSGSRVEHTFAAPGTYTVKLAMNASRIALDAYQATNGKWDCLGNPAHN